jgi:vacuolar-type H+-ATPase subunit C/Vma6
MSQVSSLLGQHFAYASGRTGVLQQLLLTASDKDRLLGAADLEVTEQILTELKMTDPIDQGLRKSDDILQALSEWIKEEVELMTPEAKRPVFHILWIEESAPLLSYLLKKHFGLTSPASREPSSSMTTEDTTQLKDLIDHNTEGTLPTALVSFVRETKKRENLTPEIIDTLASQHVANVHLSLAKKSKSPAIMQYVIHRIDLANIRTAMRLKSEVTDLSVFIKGGTLNLSKLTGDLNGIAKAIDLSNLPFSLGEAVRKSGDDLSDLEVALSKVTANDIAHMWNIPMSIEPVFAFAALAESQVALLRALVIGKRAALDPQSIKKMLPPFISASHYVL